MMCTMTTTLKNFKPLFKARRLNAILASRAKGILAIYRDESFGALRLLHNTSGTTNREIFKGPHFHHLSFCWPCLKQYKMKQCNATVHVSMELGFNLEMILFQSVHVQTGHLAGLLVAVLTPLQLNAVLYPDHVTESARSDSTENARAFENF